MTVLEGMAHRHAVVTTPVGALPEIIDHERTGLLVPVGDERELADSLFRIIGNPNFRTQLGETAYQIFLDRLEITPYTKRLKALFEECRLD